MTTPMRRQYLAIKKQFPDTVLFFRLGDFYETFDHDAEIVARVCDVVLTSRPVGNDQRVPLAGVPYHSVEPHIAKLVNAGYKVAIAEQDGNKPPPGEKLVDRAVRRVITAGTVVEPALLDAGRNNYLAAMITENPDSTNPGSIGLAFADITTGEFAATQIDGPGALRILQEELARVQPAELLVREETRRAKGGSAQDAASGSSEFLASSSLPLSHLPAWQFELETARRALLDQLEVESLAAFGCEHLPQAVRAAGALVQYLKQTQRNNLPQFTGLRTYSTSEFMTLDEATRRNLELTQTIRSGEKRGSLLSVLDATRTPMGGRLLRRWLNQPLLDLDRLNARLDAVQVWHDNTTARAELRQILRQVGDLERCTNRAAQGIARPQDLAAIRQTLALAPEIERISLQVREGREKERARESERETPPVPITHSNTLPLSLSPLPDCSDLHALLVAAIAADPPATLDRGGVIRKGYSAELDGIAVAARDAKKWVAGLERSERERTGIKSLKVGFNKVFGYYIEITKANNAAVPVEYIRKQTLVNAERYITPELKEYESLILNAEERQLELESQIFAQIEGQVGAAAGRLLQLAEALASLDVLAGLAEVAANHRYVRPLLAGDGVLAIEGGRHPVVERTLHDAFFQPNDARLSPEEAVLIITGPNMSGKSTFLRQVALITLMAQIGSFVPAERAHIGLVDRIFTRIGAQDEIHAGQSTFMVEMVEAANILHHATARSLIIFDELGRGTSTYDGLSIAWAVIEYIHNHPRLRARTLFATHYHELTGLADRLPHVVNYNVAVAEEGDSVVFLHRIAPGAADRSYGIHVAQLAGLPRPVIHRAEEILEEMESLNSEPAGLSANAPQAVQLTLFGGPSPVEEALKKLDINALSPLDALNKLYELQQLAAKAR